MHSTTHQFLAVVRAAGLTPPDVIEPGKFYRFPGDCKRNGNKAGWCRLFPDGMGGSFGDFSTGLHEHWQPEHDRPMTEAEREAWKRLIEQVHRDAEAARQAEAATMATLCRKLVERALSLRQHQYLDDKGIAAVSLPGVKVEMGENIKGDDGRPLTSLHGLCLLIPLRRDGKIVGLQVIDGEGHKRFVGHVGGATFIFGKVVGATRIVICEGFATGASIHQATGLPVVCAMTAGSLLEVAKRLRAALPDAEIVMAADDDFRTDGNPGITKATEAARSIGGLLAIPQFGADRSEGESDFNDMHRRSGLDAVKRALAHQIAPAIDEHQPDEGNADRADLAPSAPNNPATAGASSQDGVAEVSGVQASNDGLPLDTPAEGSEVSEVSGLAANPVPDAKERPVFRVFDGWTEHDGGKLRPGVWFFGTDKEGSPTQTWVCSPLHVEAVTFDGQDNHFGRLLRFKNTVGRWREWAMPMEMLSGGGDELRGELLAMGAEIDPAVKARNLLASYLQEKPPKRRMRCALQVGWCDGSFVLPDAVIGPKAANVIFQSGERGHDEHGRAGTLDGWKAEIAMRAVGNPLLALALSASFAGPLLARCNAEGGGIHFVGDSSTGKTTAIEAACSTWGGPNFRRSWRATANGTEGAAALSNDCLLALDEISECDPREVGAIVYALGNGRGKQRAGRTGSARAVARWRCFVLSSGERTIATTMAEGGHRAKAGQAVRLLDVPAMRSFGAWDTLHGLSSGTALSDALKRSATTHYGHAGRAFLERLTRDDRDFCALLERIKGLVEFSVEGGEGQDKRAAARCALLALAGELATEYGLTGWPEGEAIKAATVGFKAWRSTRGHGNDERRQIIERVSSFIERHGDARFSNADVTGESAIRDRAGWWRNTLDGREYLFTSDGMREALKSFDFGSALDALQNVGALPPPGADGKRAKFYRIGGRGVKLYPIQADKLGGDHGA